MPTSASEGKRWAAARISGLVEGYPMHKRHVLDIGPGAGTWSRLLRGHVGGHWTGVEVWGPYVEQYGLKNLYDEVIVADARLLSRWSVNPVFPEMDSVRPPILTIFGDVLEHMSLDDAADLWEWALAWSGYVMASLPIVPWEQGPHEGNPYEAHVHHWSVEEFLDRMRGVAHHHVEGPIGVFIADGEGPVSR